MRIVYMPVVSSRSVQSAPSYNFFLAFRSYMLQMVPEAVFYVVVPRLGEDTRWIEGADWSGERTQVLPMDMMESQFDDLTLVTRDFFDRFNERFGDTYFDVIFTERPSIAPMLRKLASFHKSNKSRQPLVLVRDQMVLTKEWFGVSPVDELLQAVGHSTAPTLFQSPHQMKVASRTAAKHVTPAHVERMIEHSKVLPLGIDCDDVDQINSAERGDKYPEVTVNYSHKLFMEQKFIESLSIMDSAFSGGRDIRLQVVTGSSEAKMSMIPKARRFKDTMVTYGRMNRTAFLKQMARAHIFISNSYYEDFSATVVEQIYTGLIPVLADEDWSRYLLPDDYPYLFRSMSEGNAMLRYVVDHYEEVRDEWQERLQDHVRERFDLKNIVPEMVEWVTGHHEDRLDGLRAASTLVELIHAAHDHLPEEFDLPMFYDAIKKCADNLDVTNQKTESRAVSPWLCADILRRDFPLTDLGTFPVTYRKGKT